jgi:hypothetical protein
MRDVGLECLLKRAEHIASYIDVYRYSGETSMVSVPAVLSQKN